MKTELQKPVVKRRLSAQVEKEQETSAVVSEIAEENEEGITLKEVLDPNGAPVEQLQIKQTEITGNVISENLLITAMSGTTFKQVNIGFIAHVIILVSSFTMCLATVLNFLPVWLNVLLGIMLTGGVYAALYKGSKNIQTVISLIVTTVIVIAVSLVLQSVGKIVFGAFYFLPALFITLVTFLLIGVSYYTISRRK